jgi:hypothetical protein
VAADEAVLNKVHKKIQGNMAAKTTTKKLLIFGTLLLLLFHSRKA